MSVRVSTCTHELQEELAEAAVAEAEQPLYEDSPPPSGQGTFRRGYQGSRGPAWASRAAPEAIDRRGIVKI